MRKTRKYSCVTTRGIPPAAQSVQARGEGLGWEGKGRRVGRSTLPWPGEREGMEGKERREGGVPLPCRGGWREGYSALLRGREGKGREDTLALFMGKWRGRGRGRGTPDLSWGRSEGGGGRVPLSCLGYPTPLWTEKQTENITFSYAGGNKYRAEPLTKNTRLVFCLLCQ